MTEGIIQKVFYDLQSQIVATGDTKQMWYILSKVQNMERKLIEEIKKASRLYGCTCWIETAALIGDKE